MIYEINFLVLQSKTAELDKIRKETKKFIESYGAKVVEEKEYLKRKLAYEIKHENYGFFTVLRFETKNGMNLDELKIKLNQKNNIARYIIVKADELPSLEEQETKKEEKAHTDKKTIRSEDIEKALTEQKKAETQKTTSVDEDKEEEKETEEDKPIKKSEPTNKETKKKESEANKKSVKQEKDSEGNKNKEEKEKVSLDELDKKLDEILNS